MLVHSSSCRRWCSPSTSTLQMAGWGSTLKYTPSISGTLFIAIQFGYNASTTLTNNGVVEVTYGTGTAPSAGAAAAGTVLSGPNSVGDLGIASYTTIISGLSTGTAYWFDVAYRNSNNTTQTFMQNPQITIIEL